MNLVLLFLAVVLPAYDSIKGIDRYATKAEYEAAVADKRYTLDKVEYTSDGLKVFAYVYAPKKTAKKLPVIVFNRGSYVREEFAPELLAMFRRLADSGFIVVAPTYRQSAGAEGRDEMGGADVDDLMNVMSVVRNLPGADDKNVFLYGESRGGMMTYQAIRDRFPARAAAVFGGFTDLHAMLAASPQMMSVATQIWPDYATSSASIDERRSAVLWADRLDVPLLIMHGGADSLDPGQSLALATKLQQLKKEYSLVIHAGSNHVMSDWRVERDAMVVDWFRSHMAK